MCAQALVSHAVDSWRASMASVEAQPDAALREHQLVALRTVKAVLEGEVGGAGGRF